MESQAKLVTGHVVGAIYLSTDCIATATLTHAHTNTCTHIRTRTCTCIYVQLHTYICTCFAATLRYYPCSYWQARPAVRQFVHGIPG